MDKVNKFQVSEMVSDYEPENADDLIQEFSESNMLMEEVYAFDKFSLMEIPENSVGFSENMFLTKEQINEYFPHFTDYDENKHYIMMIDNKLYYN